MKKLIGLGAGWAVPVMAAAILAGCGDSQQSAVQQLRQKHVEFTPEGFLQAVDAGELESVRLYLEGGMETDLADATGNTALIRAAARGHYPVAEYLLEMGADPDGANSEGRTALIAAADAASPEIMRLLIEKGANITAKDDEGWTAINLAAYNGNSDAVDLLAGKVDQESLDNALLVACFQGTPAVIDRLLNHGAYVNARSPGNQTPLMIAAQEGRREAVRLLLQNRANPYALDDREQTAANLAEAGGYGELAEWLLDPANAWRDEPATEGTTVEAAAKETLEALEGRSDGIVVGDPDLAESGIIEPRMASINGAVFEVTTGPEKKAPAKKAKQAAADPVNGLVLESYREKPLPVMLKEVAGDTARVRVLSSADPEPVPVRKGEIIPGTQLRVQKIEKKLVSSKMGLGGLVDVSRITVEDTGTGRKHLLVKDVPGRSSDVFAVLVMKGDTNRYAVKEGDVFTTAGSGEERAYRVLDIRPTQVIVENTATEEVFTIDRDGIAMN